MKTRKEVSDIHTKHVYAVNCALDKNVIAFLNDMVYKMLAWIYFRSIHFYKFYYLFTRLVDNSFWINYKSNWILKMLVKWRYMTLYDNSNLLWISMFELLHCSLLVSLLVWRISSDLSDLWSWSKLVIASCILKLKRFLECDVRGNINNFYYIQQFHRRKP